MVNELGKEKCNHWIICNYLKKNDMIVFINFIDVFFFM